MLLRDLSKASLYHSINGADMWVIYAGIGAQVSRNKLTNKHKQNHLGFSRILSNNAKVVQSVVKGSLNYVLSLS